MLHEKDWILREIERITAAIARVFHLKQQQDLDGAAVLLRQSYTEVFGPLGEFLAQTDAQSAARLLDDPGHIAGLARLLHAEAELRDEIGEQKEAESMRLRSLELAIEAYTRDADGISDAGELVAEYRGEVAINGLSADHRAALEELVKSAECQ
jgi:hypothetical protein